MTPTPADISAALLSTWPPAATDRIGPFLIARSDGGGSRVRAARMAEHAGDITDSDIAAAEAAMSETGQPHLFQIWPGQDALDTRLDRLGYTVKDPTLALALRSDSIAAAPPPVTCFETFPPLAIQAEIWAAGGIGPDRLAILDRVTGRRVSLFGRTRDKPAGTAFVACHGDIAMLHALEILPDLRRTGLATHMMRAAADWALRQGAVWLCVLVTRENAPAQGLYTSLGFQAVGHYHYRLKEA